MRSRLWAGLALVAGAGFVLLPVSSTAAQGSVTVSLVWSQGPFSDQGEPIAESSPIEATLDGGGPSMVVGDRDGNLYAYHLANGTAVSGWPVNDGGVPIDSTPSVAPLGPGGLDDVLVGEGNAASPVQGGYAAFSPSGSPLWFTPVTDPVTDTAPVGGVQASLTVGDLDGSADVVAGSLDQEEYALDASDGSVLGGWPFFTSDSVFSTAAIADLYGTGQEQIVEGGAQTAGFARGQDYPQGGHLRILNGRGGLLCHYDTTQTVDSSPAVGGFLAGGATGIAVGTGTYFSGVSDTDTVMVFDTHCNLVWSDTLDGGTDSSPALADVLGNNTLAVVEGTDQGTGQAGSVWAMAGSTGQVLWHQGVAGRVIGSVVAADLTGAGYDDVIVPTTAGVQVLDGRSGAVVTTLPTSSNFGFQNAPLVTDDPNGTIGITVAGYDGNNEGVILHYEVSGSNGAAALAPGSWPMFHHDPQLTGDAGGTPGRGTAAACTIPSAVWNGYDTAASAGSVFAFDQPFCGSMSGRRLEAPVVGMAESPATGGYWLVGGDGAVFAFGGAGFYGSMGGKPLLAPVVGMAATPDGRGYWLVGADGGVFAFGDAQFFGSMGGHKLHAPVVGVAATADGGGYRLVGADGGVFAFGDAQFFGSMGGHKLHAPVVGIAVDEATAGYWLVATDGGIFAFAAPFDGSMGGRPLAAPVVGMEGLEPGNGYRLVGADGGVFAFGSAFFDGSQGVQPTAPMVAVAGF